MTTFVIVLHVLVSLLLVLTVLLQPGNKGGMGAAFGGGGGGTVFGGRGANTFLAKLTAGSALVFMLTSFSLVYLSSRETSAFDRSADALAPVDTEEGQGASGAETVPAGEASGEAASATGEGAAPTGDTATEKPATDEAATGTAAPTPSP